MPGDTQGWHPVPPQHNAPFLPLHGTPHMTTLSASSISTWNNCHLQWYFTYVEVRDEPFNEPRDTGLRVHDHVEAILKADGVDHLDPGDHPDPDINVLQSLFRAEVLPTYRYPTLIEAGFELNVQGIEYTGFIDSVDVRDFPGVDAEEIIPFPMQTVLRDLKTTKNRPRSGRYRDNVIGYWQGARELGQTADLITLDYLVRTKTPYYWPEHQAPPDEDEIDIWVSQVVATSNAIEEGDWEATGVGTYVCNYCPFKDICGPYDRFKEMTE